VPIEGGPTDSKGSGKRVLFCMHETRKGDYRKHAEAVRGVNEGWKFVSHWDVPVSQKDDHPVVNVNWDDAVAFCDWLSKKEGREYRLPTDHEWSCAVGIGDQEDPDMNPENKSGRVKDAYPWGTNWPPVDKTANYGDATSMEKLQFIDIERYDDGYATTAPVMSFPPNKLGLYDLGGNAWEWCQDWYGTGEISKVLRGESWWSSGGERVSKLSSYRFKDWAHSYHARAKHYGFRCVLVVPQ
jgi:formylglycine-generating enzyme required for sulfatase activity